MSAPSTSVTKRLRTARGALSQAAFSDTNSRSFSSLAGRSGKSSSGTSGGPLASSPVPVSGSNGALTAATVASFVVLVFFLLAAPVEDALGTDVGLLALIELRNDRQPQPDPL